MAFASPSLLAPFSGLTLVWVILFSKPMTGDLPNRTQVLAATMIIIGEIIVTLAGDHEVRGGEEQSDKLIATMLVTRTARAWTSVQDTFPKHSNPFYDSLRSSQGGKKITIDEFNDIYRNTKMVLYLLSFTAFYGLVIYVAKTKEKWEVSMGQFLRVADCKEILLPPSSLPHFPPPQPVCPQGLLGNWRRVNLWPAFFHQ